MTLYINIFQRVLGANPGVFLKLGVQGFEVSDCGLSKVLSNLGGEVKHFLHALSL